MKLTIGYLYPDLMNIYGDTGNIIALKKRAEWRGIEVEVKNISIGDRIPTRQARLAKRVGSQIDLYFFGGGQDQAQQLVSSDLVSSNKGKLIKEDVERGVPLLAICGGYQLLGEYYKPHKSPKLPGIGLFSAYTVASHDRMIGNIVIKTTIPYVPRQREESFAYTLASRSELYPTSAERRQALLIPFLVGFENHSGKTYLNLGAQPLGQVLSGFGNNGEDKTEGCIYKNAIGCYMHGSLLPKNPELTDWLLKKALEVKYGKDIVLDSLDDSLENQAHKVAIQRFG